MSIWVLKRKFSRWKALSHWTVLWNRRGFLCLNAQHWELYSVAYECLQIVVCIWQIEYEKKKKEDGKRARADKQQVLDMLFSAFEKHQYYNIKDLVDITKQPVVRSSNLAI